MKGPPHRPGADDTPVIEGLFNLSAGHARQAETNAPKPSLVVLGLYRSEPPDHAFRICEGGGADLLAGEAERGNVFEF
jgi:hypothetical protein